MKSKKIKIVALAGVTVATAVMLTGCGNKEVKTYDKDQMNVNIVGMEETNNIQEENKVQEELDVSEESKSIFKDKSSLKYNSNPKADENGKIAIQKLGESIFKTQVKDGYYVYVDNFNNSYNIKEIKSITSKYYMTGNNNWANLFKCTVNYIDNNGSNKSFDAAVIIPEDNKGEYIIAPFENYTGSTSFVKGFTDLREDDPNENLENKNLSKLNISDKNLINIACTMDDFSNGQKLSADEYIEAVYHAINERYIDIEEKQHYTEAEINNIVKSIFGVNLPENKSWGTSFVYNNGIYKHERSDKGYVTYDIRNIETDVAAGTRYITYDFYIIFPDSKEEHKGKYVISISNQDNILTSKQIQK